MKFKHLALLFIFLVSYLAKAEKIYLLPGNPELQPRPQSQRQSSDQDTHAFKDQSRMLQTSVLRSTSANKLDFIKYFQIL